MKKHILLILSIFLLSCGGRKSSNPGNSDKLQFKDDGRLESMYIVFLLADYPLASRFNTSYNTAALKYFAKYKEHHAVKTARALFDKGFVADYAVNWLFQHSEMPSLRKDRTIEFPFSARVINADTLEKFRTELIEFYKEADCESFFASQKAFRDKMISAARDSLKRNDHIQMIEDYFGMKKNASYHVILSPLLHSGGFTIERRDNQEIYALVGPRGMKDSLPLFDQVYLEQDLIIHEFSHNYSNPVAEEFMKDIKKLEARLYPPVKEQVDEEGYNNWESFILELMVRATTIRIVDLNYGKEAAAELLDYEKSVGFGYVEVLCEELKNYEANRAQYKSFRDFYPRLIRSLESIQVN